MVNYQGFHIDYYDGLILDEKGNPVPGYICICAAHSNLECSCGAWDIDIAEWKGKYGVRDKVEVDKYV